MSLCITQKHNQASLCPRSGVWFSRACIVSRAHSRVLIVDGVVAVVENDQSEALKDLTLPADSMHTASVLPVQTLPTFMQRLGIAAPGPELNVVSNASLTFLEWTLKTEGLNEDQYRAAMRERLIQAQSAGAFPIVAGFVAVGYLPTQVKVLVPGNDCQNADFVLNHNDALGGPGGVRTRLLRIHTI